MRVVEGRSFKISSKLILLFFSIIIVHTSVSLISLTLNISRTGLSSQERQFQHTNDGLTRYLIKIVNDLQVKAKLFAGQDKIINYTEFGLYNLLRRQLVVYWGSLGIDTVSIFTGALESIASIGEGYVMDRQFERTLDESLDGKVQRLFTMGAANPVLTVTLPVKRDYRPLAVMAIGIRIDKEFITEIEAIFNNRIVVRIHDAIVAGDLPEELVKRVVSSTRLDRVENYIVKRIPSPLFYISGGVVYCLYDASEVSDQILRYSITSIAVSLLILSAALLIGLVFYRRTFLVPFSLLMKGIDRISGGDFSPPFESPGGDEFGELASAFNSMCSNLLKRESEISRLSSYNSLILNNMKSGIIAFGLDGGITAMNPAARRVLFGSDLAKENNPVFPFEQLPRQFAAIVEERLTGKRTKTAGEVSILVDGEEKVLSFRFSPLLSSFGEKIGVTIIFEDITRVKRLEEKLIISSRLAELGEMAAGVAHQIKNPLAVMKVSMEMLVDDLAYPAEDTETGDLSGFILNEIETLDSVVNNFLAFARPKRGLKTFESVEGIVDFAIRSIPEDKYNGVSIAKDIAPGAGRFLFDKNLIVQAISNIIANAFEASQAGSSVVVRVFRDDGVLIIEIEDSGSGMGEEEKAKMYNPFFTTKETGSGLGLSIVHRIVEDEGGFIEVDSQPGKGTKFRLVFEEVS